MHKKFRLLRQLLNVSGTKGIMQLFTRMIWEEQLLVDHLQTLHLTGELIGAKYIFNTFGTTGSSPSTYGLSYGNSAGNIYNDNNGGSLTTGAAIYQFLLLNESSIYPPSKHQYLAIGGHHSLNGARTNTIKDMLAQVINVKGAKSLINNPAYQIAPFLAR